MLTVTCDFNRFQGKLFFTLNFISNHFGGFLGFLYYYSLCIIIRRQMRKWTLSSEWLINYPNSFRWLPISACVESGQIAAYFNVPVLPTNCMDGRVDNKTLFSTVIRVAGSFPLYGEGYLQIFRYYGWRSAVLLTQSSYDFCSSLSATIAYLISGYVTRIETIDMSASPTDEDHTSYATRSMFRGRSMYSNTRWLFYLLVADIILHFLIGWIIFIWHNALPQSIENIYRFKPDLGGEIACLQSQTPWEEP